MPDPPTPGQLTTETPHRAPDAETFRLLAELAPAAVFIYAGDRFVWVNNAAEEITGYAREQLASMSLRDLVHPEHRAMVEQEATAGSHSSPRHSRNEFKLITRDGDERWVHFSATFVPYNGASAMFATAIDVHSRKQAEEALQKSEELFRNVIENSSDMMAIIDFDGRILYESPVVQRILGWDPQLMVGNSAFDYIHPDDMEQALHAFRVAINEKVFIGPVVMRARHVNGSYRSFEVVSSHFYDKGVRTGLICSFRHMDSRHQSEMDLRESERKYRFLFERNLAGVFVTTLDGRIIDCNDAVAEIYGYTREQFLNINSADLYFDPADRAKFIAMLERDKTVSDVETLCRRRDGTPVWVLENASIFESEPGGPRFIQGTSLDITARKFGEQALAESESKFRSLAETAASAIYIHDGERFLFINHASELISGYSHDELMKMSPWQFVHPDFADIARTRFQQRRAGFSVPERYEFKIVHKSGEERWLDFSASSILFEGRHCVIATAFDITERKRTEQLHSILYRIATLSNSADGSQDFFRTVHSILSEVMYAENVYIAVLDKTRTKLQFVYFADVEDETPGERSLKKGLTEYILRSGEPLHAHAQRTRELEHAGEVELIGEPCVDWIGAPLRARNTVIGVIALQSYAPGREYSQRDLELLSFAAQHIGVAIERDLSQHELRESEQRHRSLIQSAVYGIYRSSAKHDRFLSVNPALVRMIGYGSEEEVLALRLSRDLYADPDQRQRLMQQFLRKNDIDSVEARWVRADGRVITVRLSGRVVHDADGGVSGFEMIAEDVTERRHLEEQLRHSQKMDAVGRLAGGVAHDFNNLLTVIKGYSELLLDELSPADPLRGEVDEIRRASERAAQLTRQLLAFSRQQVLTPKIIDINSVVSNMERLLNRLLGEDIQLVTIFGPGVGCVEADPGQLEQVIMNLAVNARDAIEHGGKLTIETANIELDDAFTRDHTGSRPGSYVMLTVSDTGNGMPEEVRNRVFEPFFTTKEVGKGTGLGLSTVYGIIKQSNGYINVESAPGAGTTFRIYLPRVEALGETSDKLPVLTTVQDGTGTILLVEDEDGVRALVRQVLQRRGYNVLEARHGGEALILCERHTGDIDLLLTDVILEHLNGPELAERLLKMRPQMRVLYMSGYAPEAILQRAASAQHVNGSGAAHAGDAVMLDLTHFLPKPFTADALAKKVREVMQGIPRAKAASAGY